MSNDRVPVQSKFSFTVDEGLTPERMKFRVTTTKQLSNQLKRW